MSNLAIGVENLGKCYRIGQRERYYALRDVLARSLTVPLRRFRNLQAENHNCNSDHFWALKDISFEVKEGEVVGIIGRNGAGKSTLLKILSRITKPTEGHAKVYGRVGSLLEVGTGFHPELTGRENIYLNGAILGMKKAEIDRKFDEIVAFAEVEKFIDTPVKRYSSGMYVRLAFAVAAHLEPEILLVDEVLAVGDAAFQKKCMGKMGDVAKAGRTVLFVSHNMAAIRGLCHRGILFDSGCIIAEGDIGPVVDQYMRRVGDIASVSLLERSDRRGNRVLEFVNFELRDMQGRTIPRAFSGQDVVLAFRYRSSNGFLRDVHIALGIHGKFDERLFHLSTTVNGFEFEKIPSDGTIFCSIPRLPLQAGRYSFNLFCTVAGDIADWIQNAGTLEVEAGNFFGSGKLPPSDQGPFIVTHAWSIAR